MDIKQLQVEYLIIKAFSRIGEGLGDLLFNEEIELISNGVDENKEVEIYNDSLTKELDSILADSYKQLLVKVKSALDHENLKDG